MNDCLLMGKLNQIVFLLYQLLNTNALKQLNLFTRNTVDQDVVREYFQRV